MAHIHGVYDTDTHFSIDPLTRQLKYESEKLPGIVQYDHNSQVLTFEVPRHTLDGHDMSLCNKVRVHYINIDTITKEKRTGLYDVKDLQVAADDENVVLCSWPISRNATQMVGNLAFALRLACTENGEEVYGLSTVRYDKLTVSGGVHNDEAIVEEYADILDDWEARIQALEQGGATDEQIAAAVEAYMAENPVGGGTVKTVNGVAPDENGNVQITMPDSGGNVDLTGYMKLPTNEDGTPDYGTVGYYAVSDGNGGITWVAAGNTGGGSSGDDTGGDSGGDTGDDTGGNTGEPVDTSPVIEQYGYALTQTGTTAAKDWACYTTAYAVDGVGKDNYFMYFIPNYDGVSPGAFAKVNRFMDGVFNTYESLTYQTSADAAENQLKVLSSYGDYNSLKFTLVQAYVDDSYMYNKDTGDILFAGKNTKYYGMANIDGTIAGGGSSGDSGTSEPVTAAEVDNQIAMLSLTTGEAVDTAAYSGLSEEYVAMVQANYDSMMAECLGDYNKIPIIVHTDQHARIGATNPVMALIGDMVNWYEISKCMNLGDTVSGTFAEGTLQNYLSATKDHIPLSKRLEVYGNHDVWDSVADQKYTVNQKRLSPYFKNIYARRHSNNGYFTVVDDYYNVKYLVINNFEYPDTNYATRRITTAQAKFIVEELSANDGRDIVLVAHQPLDSDEVTTRDDTYIAYSEKLLSDTTAHNSFMDMMTARKNKTSGNFTDSEGVAHTYDFTNVSGSLLMSLHGHAHFEAYRTFENSITEFIFDWFDGNTFYFGYIDRENMKFKCWKNEIGVEALEISIA